MGRAVLKLSWTAILAAAAAAALALIGVTTRNIEILRFTAYKLNAES